MSPDGKRKIASSAIRVLATVNLTALVAILGLDGSRRLALAAFLCFRICALIVSALVVLEFLLGLSRESRGKGLLPDTLLALTMLGVWFLIRAATF